MGPRFDPVTRYATAERESMLTAILVLMVFQVLFVMAVVGHMSAIEKMMKALLEAKVEEMKLWGGNAKR